MKPTLLHHYLLPTSPPFPPSCHPCQLQSGPKTIQVEATAETIEANNVIEETPKGETTPLTAAPETSASESVGTAVINGTTNMPATVNDKDEEEQAASTANPAPASSSAAPPPSFRERVVAVSRRGMEKVGEAYETARAKLRLTKALFGKTKPAPAAAAAGAAAGGEVGEGEGAAAASELPAEGGAVVLEEAGDETSPAAAAKTTRGFWARKARWASKRCTEVQDKVVSGVTAAKQGAKAQLQALKKSFSRKRNSSQ